MRYIFTAIWAVLISIAVAYVLGAMAGGAFVIEEALILGAILFVFVVLMGEFVVKTDKKES